MKISGKNIKRICQALWRMAESLLFPDRCPMCDGLLPYPETGVCVDCAKKVRYVLEPYCMKCGKKIADSEVEYCVDCRKRPHKFVRGRALYEYQTAAPALYRLKYGGRREYAEVFGEEMAFFLGDFIRACKPDALIPVPMHPSRVRRRGYNQAELLARAVGARMNIPVYTNLVRRVQNTRALKTLNREERLNYLKKAFILCQNGVKLSSVIIVDDIYTTGSTIDAVCHVLLSEGEKQIYFIALASGEGI